MRIAFLSFGDAGEISNWSGTVLHMLQMFKYNNDEVTIIDQIEKTHNPVIMLFRLYEKISGKPANYKRMPYFIKTIGKRIERKISGKQFDLIFSPSSIPLAYLNSSVPKVFWTDATFNQMLDYYPEFTNLSESTVRWGNRLEKLSLHNSVLAVYSSDWAANSAISDYKISSDKVMVVPFGSNLESEVSEKNIDSVIENRIKDKSIKLLSIGNEWTRKGFDISIQVAQVIKNSGRDVQLSIVGAQAPEPGKLPSFIRHYGQLDKNNKEDLNLLKELYLKSHFFILPSQAECSAIVFAEASAFALPSLSRKTGGIPTMVKDGINGFLMEYNASPAEYANKILDLLSDENTGQYSELSKTTWKRYNDELNWPKAFKTILAKLIGIVNPDYSKSNDFFKYNVRYKKKTGNNSIPDHASTVSQDNRTSFS